MPISRWMLEELVCPCDGAELTASEETLRCPAGHEYRCVDGIPVMLTAQLRAALPDYWSSSDQIAAALAAAPAPGKGEVVDPVVNHRIVATHGNLYKTLPGRLPRYPIPDFPLAAGGGRALLDIGCNWGRWTIAAHRAGYRPIGIDPSFEAILAARRVASQLGLPLRYVCADARCLPFRKASFDAVFSYSVLQHLSTSDVALVIEEIRRVLKPAGASWVQMPGAFGLLGLYRQCRRGFREARDFEVRYWSPSGLTASFGRIGPTRLLVDGFFSLNAQSADLDLLPRRNRAIVRMSGALRRVSRALPPLVAFADSLMVVSTRTLP